MFKIDVPRLVVNLTVYTTSWNSTSLDIFDWFCCNNSEYKAVNASWEMLGQGSSCILEYI